MNSIRRGVLQSHSHPLLLGGGVPPLLLSLNRFVPSASFVFGSPMPMIHSLPSMSGGPLSSVRGLSTSSSSSGGPPRVDEQQAIQALINSRLKGARSVGQVMSTVLHAPARLSSENISGAFHQLWLVATDDHRVPVLNGFEELCSGGRLRMIELSPSGLAHIIRALGTLSQIDQEWYTTRRQIWSPLLVAALKKARKRMDFFSIRDITNIVYGLAKFYGDETHRHKFLSLCSGVAPGDDLIVLIDQFCHRASTLLKYQVANDVMERDRDRAIKFAERVQDLKSGMGGHLPSPSSSITQSSPQQSSSSASLASASNRDGSGDRAEATHVALLVWSLAELESGHHDFLDAAGIHLEHNITRYSSLDLGNIMIGIGRIRYSAWPFFNVIASVVHSRNGAEAIRLSHLSSIIWAFSRCNQTHYPQMMSYICQRLSSSPPSLIQNRELAQILYSYAELGYIEEKLFVRTALLACERLPSFTAVQLANLTWAFAAARIHPGESFLYRARAALEEKIPSMTDRSLVAAAWSLALLNVEDNRLFSLFAKECQRRFVPQPTSSSSSSDTEEIDSASHLIDTRYTCQWLWSLLSMGHLRPELLQTAIPIINGMNLMELEPHLIQLHQCIAAFPSISPLAKAPNTNTQTQSSPSSSSSSSSSSSLTLDDSIVAACYGSVARESRISSSLLNELLLVSRNIDPHAIPNYQNDDTLGYRIDVAIVDRKIGIELTPATSLLSRPPQLRLSAPSMSSTSPSQWTSSSNPILSSFGIGSELLPAGNVVLKDRHLAQSGWRLLRLDQRLWEQLNDTPTRMEFISDWIRTTAATRNTK